jgi:hypothetical protein
MQGEEKLLQSREGVKMQAIQCVEAPNIFPALENASGERFAMLLLNIIL